MKTDVSNIEAYWIKISSINIYICGFYRSSGYCKLENFIEYFTQCMKKLKGKKVIWIGDINIDQNKINNTEYKNFDLTLKSFGMVQTIQNYTRTVQRGNKITRSTIDVILTNCYSDFKSSSVLPDSIGDHNAIKCELNFKVEKAPKYEKISFHNYSNDNINAFKNYLQHSDFSPILECNDVNMAILKLNAILNYNHDHFFPLKTVKKHQKFIYKPSQDSLKAIKVKKKLHKKFKEALKRVSSLTNVTPAKIA